MSARKHFAHLYRWNAERGAWVGYHESISGAEAKRIRDQCDGSCGHDGAEVSGDAMVAWLERSAG